MSTRFSRSTAVVLALVLCLALLPAAAQARPSGAASSRPHGTPFSLVSNALSWVWQGLWEAVDGARGQAGLRSAGASEGGSIDPNGNHLPGGNVGSPTSGGNPLTAGPGAISPQI